jgi:hypothetical protein
MRKMLAALIGAAATVTMIAGAGVASASPAHPASPAYPAAITHPASAHRAVTGTEHFQIVSTSLTSSRSKVVAYGVFNASGVDIATSNTRDTFKFPGGKFRVTHHATRSRQHFSTRTCAGTFRERGTYKISHGTGKYAGISGHGRYRLRGLIVARHTAHGCSRRPIAIQVIIRAHGPVTLP